MSKVVRVKMGVGSFRKMELSDVWYPGFNLSKFLSADGKYILYRKSGKYEAYDFSKILERYKSGYYTNENMLKFVGECIFYIRNLKINKLLDGSGN
jgi:hypothetical protein